MNFKVFVFSVLLLFEYQNFKYMSVFIEAFCKQTGIKQPNFPVWPVPTKNENGNLQLNSKRSKRNDINTVISGKTHTSSCNNV